MGRWIIHPLVGLWGQWLVSPQVTAQHYSAGNLNVEWGHALWGAIGDIRECCGGCIGSSLGLWEDMVRCKTQFHVSQAPGRDGGKGPPLSTHHLLDFCCDTPILVPIPQKNRQVKRENWVTKLLLLIKGQVFLCWEWLFRPSSQIKEKQYSLLYLFLQVTCEHIPHAGLTECQSCKSENFINSFSLLKINFP